MVFLFATVALLNLGEAMFVIDQASGVHPASWFGNSRGMPCCHVLLVYCHSRRPGTVLS